MTQAGERVSKRIPVPMKTSWSRFLNRSSSRRRKSGELRVIEGHGGRISVESKLGEGTCCTVLLLAVPDA